MKKTFRKICISIAIVLIATFLCTLFPISHAEQTTVQDNARTFIENALPLDSSKYNIADSKQSNLAVANGVINTVRFNLTSAESTVTVICDFQNNILRSCQVSEDKGSAISDKQYANFNDAVKSFLGKYQNYTKLDSTNFAAMLDKVDTTKNTTTITGNTKLTVTNAVWFGKDITGFEWTYTVNGVDYTSLQVSFQKNGMLYTLYDDRALYTVGDTSIDVSSDQAIDIAMKNLSTYSYAMPDQTIVSNFNVTKDKITTTIAASALNSSNVLKPYWTVIMPLNQTYPGSVQGIEAFIWADTGKIITYGNIAYGGVDYSDNSGLEATTSTAVSSQSPSTESNSASPNTLFAVVIAAAVIGLATASVALIKKRKK